MWVLRGKTSGMTKFTTSPLTTKLVVEMQPVYAEVIFSFNSPLTPGDLPQFLRFPINPQVIIPTPTESPLTPK